MAKKRKKSLTHKMYLNSATSLFAYFVTMAVTFVVNPLLLSFLGNSLFGIWKFCQRLFTYVAVAGGRPTQALKWTIANKQDSEDIGAKRRDVGSAVFVWFMFLPVFITVGGIVSWFSPYLINGLPSDQSTVVRLTCFLLFFNMALSMLQAVPHATLVGTNQAYRCVYILVIEAIVSGGLLVWTASQGWGLMGLAGALICTTIIKALLTLSLAKKYVSWFGINRPQKGEIKPFFQFSFWVLCWSFVSKLILSGDILILGLAISAEMVTSYSLCQYIMQLAISLTDRLVSAVIPGLGGIVGKKDFERASQIRAEIMAGTWLITAVLAAMILIWNSSFIRLWVGENIYVGPMANLMMMLVMLQLVFIRKDAFIIDLTLNIRNKVLLGAGASILGLVLAYFLAKKCSSSIVGLTIGLLIGRSILMISYPIMVNKKFGFTNRSQAFGLVRPFLVMSLIFSISYYLGTNLNVTSWIYLIFGMIGSASVLTVIVYFLGLTTDQRSQIVNRVRQVRTPRSI